MLKVYRTCTSAHAEQQNLPTNKVKEEVMTEDKVDLHPMEGMT